MIPQALAAGTVVLALGIFFLHSRRHRAVEVLALALAYGLLGPWVLLAPWAWRGASSVYRLFRRIQSIRSRRSEFPMFLDSLGLSYAAGATLATAIEGSVLMMRGPLKHDVARLRSELQSSNNWRQPLRRFAEQTHLPEASRLAESLIREHILGISPVSTLERHYELLSRQRLQAIRKRNALIPYVLTVSVSVLLINCVLLLAVPNAAQILKTLGPL